MDEKKKLILRAAHDIFAENGYKQTNIARISKRAGISVGSFYKYYESKEEVFVQVYIQENERMRKLVIEEVDWQASPLQVMEELFDQIINHQLSNRILSEWNNPKVGDRLRSYYLSKEGTSGNSFHRFIIDYIFKYLSDAGYGDEEIRQILRVYELVYFIDCGVSEEDFAEKEKTIKVLLTYFIKGVLSR